MVYLSACTSAKTRRDTSSEGLGIAQAFIAAGSRFAIAVSRPIEDDVASAFAAGFYERLSGDPLSRQAVREAFASALRRLSAERPQSDYGALRLFEARD